MRRPLVAGNWKMHGTLASAEALAGSVRAAQADLGAVDVVLCPAFVHLERTARALDGASIGLGAQDVWTHDAGAFTGSVSGPMLREIGCRWVLVGHSERRALNAETDALVAENGIPLPACAR